MKKMKTGEVYTPPNIVDKMLDFVEYNSNFILKKHIIDNSCGKGAFLLKIVERYIEVANKENLTELELINDLETYIHGIEINEKSYLETLNNLNYLVKKKGITKNIDWDILNKDTLEFDKYNRKMDFVVGNPPYIRIHDLNFNYKKFEFSKKGMTDLYIIFFELGINMLSATGKMAYITPNSYLTSNSGLVLRKYLVQNNLVQKILDFKFCNPFNSSISVYSIITILDKKKSNDDVAVFDINNSNDKPYIIKNNDYYIDNKFIFARDNDRIFFKKIINEKNNNLNIYVKNGLSTNADNLFFNDNFSGKYIISAIKASKESKTKLFFPYDTNGKIVSLEDIKLNNNEFYNYLLENKEILCNRSIKNSNNWYGFGRAQGIKDTFKERLVINNIIKNIDSIKINKIKPGVAIYGGFYIYSTTINSEKIIECILSKNFISYLKCLNKLKCGGYYTYSSIDLRNYLNYSLKKYHLH